MSTINWLQVVIGFVQSVLSGIFVGIAIYWLDERRAKRERRLSDFRIASNWQDAELKVSLRDFDLTKTNLSGHKFKKANLEGTILFETILWGSSFEGANLRHADFRKARMVGVKAANAIAVGANFSHATITKKIDPENNFLSDFSKISLKGAKFIGTRLNGVVLKEASLRGTDFSKAIVLECDFTGADLNDSNWKKVKRVENCIWKDVKFAQPENFTSFVWKEIQEQNAK